MGVFLEQSQVSSKCLRINILNATNILNPSFGKISERVYGRGFLVSTQGAKGLASFECVINILFEVMRS